MWENVLLVSFSISVSVGPGRAWIAIPATTTHSSRRTSSIPMTLSDEGESFGRFSVTTKTHKKLIFDDQKGRFFETSLASDSSFSAAANKRFDDSYELATNIPFTNNEMVPTELLFRNRKSSYVKEELPELLVALQGEQPESKPMLPTTALATVSIVEEFFAAWNDRDLSAVMACFEDNIEYQDGQYWGTMTSKAELRQHIENQSKLLPCNARIVLENIAVDPNNGNIGAQWYLVEDGSDKPLPFTRGCSFYQTNPTTGLIQKGFKVSEMIVKPNKQAADRLVASVSSFPQLPASSTYSIDNSITPTTQSSSSSNNNNIIEAYFNAWNRRDMNAALDCFVDDCVYQTEDPVFVDTFRGKAALRAHLEKNAQSLPASCQICLDQVAVDSIEHTIATTWHLEVNGIAIPNLKGCSMYTTTEDGRLLKTGFDVTEAPVKIPRQVLVATTRFLPQQLLQFPANALFGR